MLRSISEINIHHNNKSKRINIIIRKFPKKLPKDFDYLKVLREKKPNKNNVINYFNWDKLANKTGNKFENIEVIQSKIKYIEEKAKRDEEILKLKGGSIKNPDLSNHLSDLLINSIKGKLSIIDTLKSG